MINCIIVDDEPLAQDVLEKYIKNNDSLNLIAKCNTAIQAFEVLHHKKTNLIFLDIKMPGLNGIDFLKSLKMPPAVIFTTAFSEYAAASYDLEAIDYLLKPITQERFNKSLEKLFRLQPIVTVEVQAYTYFKVSGKLVKIAHEGILYAQSIKDYLMLYTHNGNFIVHMTMKYLATILPQNEFLRVHRSYLINQVHIKAIGKNHLFVANEEIPIGENYKDSVKKMLIME